MTNKIADAIDPLLPCPFCNSGSITIQTGSNYQSGAWYYGHCANCHATTAIKKTFEEAKTAWNTRTQAARLAVPDSMVDARHLPLEHREALSEAAMAAARQFDSDPGNFLKIAQAAIYTWHAIQASALSARVAELEQQRDGVRDTALEEAAKVLDEHAEGLALIQAKNMTPSEVARWKCCADGAAAIRALKKGPTR